MCVYVRALVNRLGAYLPHLACTKVFKMLHMPESCHILTTHVEHAHHLHVQRQALNLAQLANLITLVCAVPLRRRHADIVVAKDAYTFDCAQRATRNPYCAGTALLRSCAGTALLQRVSRVQGRAARNRPDSFQLYTFACVQHTRVVTLEGALPLVRPKADYIYAAWHGDTAIRLRNIVPALRTGAVAG